MFFRIQTKKPYENPEPSKDGRENFEQFIKEYGGLNFNKVVFRPRASFTCDFGLTERYKITNDKVVWGYPGIHKGIDRGGSPKVSKKGIPNPIFSPFHFGSSGYKDWQGRFTGTDVYLYHKYGFRIKIGHMFPDEIDILDKLTSGIAIKAGEWIGPIGSYGFSTAAHSHVEIESWGFKGEWLSSCGVLDIILKEKYGSKVDKELNTEEIVSIYDSCEFTEGWPQEEIIRDYQDLNLAKGIVFINKYKLVVRDKKWRDTTLYSTKALFGM